MKTHLVTVQPRTAAPGFLAQRLNVIERNFVRLSMSAPWVAPMAAADAVDVLCQEIHWLNVHSGWWHNLSTGELIDRDFGQLLCLTHSEVSEAWEANRLGIPDSHLSNFPGEFVELADVLIRCFDWMGAARMPVASAFAGITLEAARVVDHPMNMILPSRADKYMALHGWISGVLEVARRLPLDSIQVATPAAFVILQVLGLAAEAYPQEGLGLDLLCRTFSSKLEYNQSRLDHMPAMRRDGGKKI